MEEAGAAGGRRRPRSEEEEEGGPPARSARRGEQAPPPPEDEPEDGEKSHFLEVCHSCLGYRQDAMQEVGRFQAMCNSMAPEDMALWGVDVREWVSMVTGGIEMNARFLQMLPTPEVCGAVLSQQDEMAVYQVPLGHRVASRNSSKVRTTLRQFVRDWAVEGQAERAMTYGPLIEALGRHMPAPLPGSRARKPRVLCPGSGLGRLPFDLARLGYAAQGNEFSYHMILGSHLIYNRTSEVGCYPIFPFILSTVNRIKRCDNLRCVRIPDTCPALALSPESDVSMAAGEFVSVYENQVKEWDAVATAFFLDTAKNIFLYVRTIAGILRTGGVWTNLGPLLYHFADVENDISIELSWEEVRPFICKYFDIVEEERKTAPYTMNHVGMMKTVFNCVFFTAVRNAEPVSGKSNPVY